MSSTSAHTAKAKALLKLITKKDGALDSQRVLELVRALLATNVASKREIAREIGRQSEIILNNQKAIVTSSTALTPELQQQIFKTIQKQHPQLRSVEWLVEPQLLGGFTILVGDTWYDTTVANDLTTIREQLSQ